MSAIKGLIFNKYVAVFLVVMAAIGWNKFQNGRVNAAKAELAEAVKEKVVAQSKLKDAASLNSTLKLSLEMQAEDAEVQARAADQARAKERLAWQRLNKLQKEIANVPTSQNVPVSDHVQSVLNAIADELRSPVPGDGGPDSANESGDEGAGDPVRRDVPEEASPASETPVS